jgi:uncharacterized protein YdhG (YjbR/CyaY superfamily)
VDASQPAPGSVDAYIAAFPPEVQAILQQIRSTVRAVAPEAQETIKYQMPTFTLNGKNLVHFAAFKGHIGFYPAPPGDAGLGEELAAYTSGKGTLKFPLDQPIPLALIEKTVRYRMGQRQKRRAGGPTDS